VARPTARPTVAYLTPGAAAVGMIIVMDARHKNSGPEITPDTLYGAGVHPPAAISFYIVTMIGAVKLPRAAHPAVQRGPSVRWRA
jgi:hypothetical protein